MKTNQIKLGIESYYFGIKIRIYKYEIWNIVKRGLEI